MLQLYDLLIFVSEILELLIYYIKTFNIMKYLVQTILALLFVSISINTIYSQASVLQKDIEYKSWVKTMDGTQNQKGFLAELKDSSIVFGSQQKLEDIAISNMKQINFRKKNAIGKSMGYGALIGFGLGAVIGLASGDDKGGFISFTAEEKALAAGIFLTIPGAIIGALVGSAKVKIPINGKMDQYERQRMKIQKYSLMD